MLKKISIVFPLLFIVGILFSQNITFCTTYSISGQTSLVSGNTYTVSGSVTDYNNIYNGASVAVGDSIFYIEDGRIYAGAIGDNSTDNYSAMTAYLNYCRTFQKKAILRKGIYKTSIGLNFSLLDIEGNGCTIKRWEHAGTAGNITSNYTGGTTVNVTDGSKFIVGQSVSMCSGDADSLHNATSENTRIITAISTNAITISSAWTTSYTTGTGKLFTNYTVISFGSTVANQVVDTVKTVVDNLTFDGNKNSGIVNYGWSVNTFCYAEYKDAVFNNCRFQNISNENIVATNKVAFNNCTIRNTNGGLFHITGTSPYNTSAGSNQIIVEGLISDSTNLADPTKSQHSEALFTYSVEVKNVKINNVRANYGRQAVFGTGNITSENTKITNSEFYNFASIGFAQKNKRWEIRNNKFHTCGNLNFNYFQNDAIDSLNLGDINIEGNTFINSKLLFSYVKGAKVESNTFYTTPAYWFSSYSVEPNPPAIYARNAQIAVVGDCRNIRIRHNTLTKPQYINTEMAGIYIETTGNSGTPTTGSGVLVAPENIEVSNNTVKGYFTGLQLGGHFTNNGVASLLYGTTRNIKGFIAKNNVIIMPDSSAYTTTSIGIRATAGVMLTNNEIYQTTASAPNNYYGLHVTGFTDNTSYGAIAQFNKVYHSSAVRCQLFADMSNTWNMQIMSNDDGSACFDTTGLNLKNNFFSEYYAIGTAPARSWTIVGNDIYSALSGNVGIGTTTPPKKLSVVGDADLNGLRVGRGLLNNSTNTAIGLNALDATTTGIQNTVVGSQAGKLINTGNNNTIIGELAGSAMTSGSVNTLVGRNAGKALTSQYSNVAVGTDALILATAADNTALGAYALQSTITGGRNVGVGYNALGASTGADNVGIGYGAGATQTAGARNIAIGKDAALPSTTGSDQLSIGNWIYGINAGDIGIGTTAPTRKLTVGGSTAPYMSFKPNATNQEHTIGVDANGFMIYNDVVSTYRMIITNAGLIGINTTSPSNKLTVDAAIGGTGDPMKLIGLNIGAVTDSFVTSNNGVFKRMTLNDMLETTTSSLRIPRVTTTQRDALNGAAGSVTGDVIYNSTTDTYQVADGATSNWINLATGTTTYFSGSYDNTIAAGSRDSVVITVSGLTTSTGAGSVYYVATVHESGILISPAKIESGQIKIYLDNLNLITAKAFAGALKVMVRRL